MVGILIGLIVVLVIFNLLSISEGYKRMATASSDSQITGLLSQFMVGREAANGGNGISLSAAELITCNAATASKTWRPIPVLITDSASNDLADSFITFYSASPHVVWPVVLTSDSPPAADLIVQSPNGFSSPSPAVTPYRVVAINPVTGDCEGVTIGAATVPDAFGRVTLTQGTIKTAKTYTATVDPQSSIVNLGPVGLATRARYELWDSATSAPCASSTPLCQVVSTDLLTAGASRNPLAQNVVLMKVQYGVDLSIPLNGTVDCWTPADNANICGAGAGLPTDFRTAAIEAAPAQVLDRIVAVRIGLVVRSEEQGTRDEVDPLNLASPLRYTNRPLPSKYLFNCAANDLTCQSRILLSNNVLRDGWRYRTYEVTVPLRNAIYNMIQ
jgi:hypothetical protein